MPHKGSTKRFNQQKLYIDSKYSTPSPDNMLTVKPTIDFPSHFKIPLNTLKWKFFLHCFECNFKKQQKKITYYNINKHIRFYWNRKYLEVQFLQRIQSNCFFCRVFLVFFFLILNSDYMNSCLCDLFSFKV